MPLSDYASILFDELTSRSQPAPDRWARVVKLVSDAEEESLHLDFKEVTVAPPANPADDPYILEKLARSLSGFANVGGGLLIYGIRTAGGGKGQPDRAQAITPIPSLRAFRASIEKRASLVVDPVIASVDVREVEDPSHPDHGVLAILVPESLGGPHRAVRTRAETNERYFMRTTTEIQTMPHSLLADRFARVARPVMRVVAMLTIGGGGVVGVGLNIKLRNVGRGVASQPAIRFNRIDSRLDWRSITQLNAGWQILWPKGVPNPTEVVYVSDPGFVVYPTVDVVPIHVRANAGGVAQVHIEGELFCREAGSVPFNGDVLLNQETVLPP
jgi:hypothetical protein